MSKIGPISWILLSEAGWIRVGKLLIQYKYKTATKLFSERQGFRPFYNVGFGYRIHIEWSKP